MKATRYRGMAVVPATTARPAHLPASHVRGWQATCPDCGWTTWGSVASHVREAITAHRLSNWPPCQPKLERGN